MKIRENRLEFEFPAHFDVVKYDDLPFYRKHFQKAFGGDQKGVDFLALDKVGNRLWILEVKDFRIGHRDEKESLVEAIPFKVRDTILGMAVAGRQADPSTAKLKSFQDASEIRVVFHCEQPTHPSKLFPGARIPVDYRDRLRQRLKLVDPHPLVVSMANPQSVPWKAKSVRAS